jgi:hypothetical protein
LIEKVFKRFAQWENLIGQCIVSDGLMNKGRLNMF